ncbi:isoprenoid synthase domain-containing protein [Trametes maxima]|nr:isoprenoid synthase domain-containing protein [Trametes maxima]
MSLRVTGDPYTSSLTSPPLNTGNVGTHSFYSVISGNETPSSPPTRLCTLVHNAVSQNDAQPSDTESLRLAETKHVIGDFITHLQHRTPHYTANPMLWEDATAVILSWNAGLTEDFVKTLTDTGCTLANIAYAHVPYEYQLIVALYTAYVTYIDDLGGRDPNALGQFGHRFITREGLAADPVLERFMAFLQDMYRDTPYTFLNADIIVTSTLDGLVGRYIECTAKNMAIARGATRYSTYLRQKTGYGLAYAAFNFVKGWRDPCDNIYLQLIPEIDQFACSLNDVLSFYKESLDGETDNYVHVRAGAEQKDPIAVLRELCDETLRVIDNIKALTTSDPQLNSICCSFLTGFIEFHLQAKRYKLEDLRGM